MEDDLNGKEDDWQGVDSKTKSQEDMIQGGVKRGGDKALPPEDMKKTEESGTPVSSMGSNPVEGDHPDTPTIHGDGGGGCTIGTPRADGMAGQERSDVVIIRL